MKKLFSNSEELEDIDIERGEEKASHITEQEVERAPKSEEKHLGRIALWLMLPSLNEDSKTYLLKPFTQT